MDERLVGVDTNSADDSSGIAFGLQGNLYLPVALAAMISIGCTTLLIYSSDFSIPIAIAIGAMPFTVTLLLVLTFFNNKPPHFASDWLESLGGPGNFRRVPQGQPKHPEQRLEAAKAKKPSPK